MMLIGQSGFTWFGDLLHDRARRRGHTLVEMVSAMAILTILCSVIGSLMMMSGHASEGATLAADQSEHERVLTEFAEDARLALGFVGKTDSAITLAVPDRTGDGLHDYITYAWTGSPGSPGTLTRSINGGTASTLLKDVHNFLFQSMTRTVTPAASTASTVLPTPNPSAWGYFQAGSTAGLTFLDFTETKEKDNTDRISIATPDGTAAGDLLIACVATDGDNTEDLAAQAGWTLLGLDDRWEAVTFGVWWKIATDTEPASHEFTWNESEEAYGWIMRFSGHDPVNPIHATSIATYGSGDTPYAPAITTTVPGTLVLRVAGFDDDDITTDDPGLTGHTVITMDESGGGSGTASGGAGYIMAAEAGAVLASQWDTTSLEQCVTMTIAIQPPQ